ncbi:prolipoprotein diacylglyceryl transferase family protein [Arhodomonas sp. SL1]|uniref:TlpA family protein disulfide reductase n=1 Tax=Arhodomonas sp. SL1 TaxID=3425691 RepID=UPI003F8849B2
MLSTAIGPIAISVGQLLLACALAVALLTAWASARRPEERVAHLLVDALLIGLAAARIAFVVRYLPQYQQDWLGMLDIRDGGFLPVWGGLAAAPFLAWRLWQAPVKCRPLANALFAGGLTWGLTAGVITMIESESRALPATEMTTLNNKTVTLAELSEQPLVVNLWASWCPPCRREMPVLEAAQRQRTDITFVFANQGEGPGTIRNYLDNEGLGLDNVLMDRHRELGETVGAGGLPTTLFYDASGKLADVHLGELSRATLQQSLDKLDAGR